jgi:hypothetical protein
MRDLRWCVPLGLALAALLALTGGTWWSGWLAYSALLVPGLWILAGLWRWGGSGRHLGMIIATAFLLRLACGTALTLLLPSFGHQNPEQSAGYVFYDAYRRDSQAWRLAKGHRSLESLSKPFVRRRFVTDQYGGMLAISLLLYRGLSPDYHRQLLVIVLGALVAAMGIPLVWRAARELAPPSSLSPPAGDFPDGDDKGGTGGAGAVALTAAWIVAVYPESVLQGASQMREPFLITFTAFVLWGFLAVRRLHLRSGWLWLAGGLLGLLLFSPGIALANLAILGGWIVLESGRRRSVSWLLAGGLALIFLLGLTLLAASWKHAAWGPSVSDIISNWVQFTLNWNLQALGESSGMVQYLFARMPAGLHLPFIGAYGMLQPVLPSALIEPTVALWRIVGTLRAAGWYTLLPLLVYGVIAALKTDDPARRRLWLWLVVSVWIWILITALRGGADQWDNPRYRVILLPWQALVAAYALTFWRQQRDRWMGRIIALEVLFLLIFTIWYGGRYLGLPAMNFWGYVLLILIVGLAAVVIDLVRERRANRPVVDPQVKQSSENP